MGDDIEMDYKAEYAALVEDHARLSAECREKQEHIDALQAKVHLCAGYDALVAECRKARDALLGHAGGSVALACLNRALGDSSVSNRRSEENAG